MALAFQSIGSFGEGSTTVNPGYPASTAAGNILVLVIGTKPFNATIGSPGPDWRPLGTIANGSTGQGLDTGSVLIAAFVKEANGTETGTLVVNVTSGNSSWGVMSRYTKAAGQAFTADAAFGTDTTTGTAFSITFGSNPGITSGDMLHLGAVQPSDQNSLGWTSPALSATSATIGAITQDISCITVVGNDLGGSIQHCACTAGTASANPVWTGTLASSTGSTFSGVIVRLREIAPGTLTHLAMGVHQ